MHPTQLEILDSLRQADSKQFAELLRDVAETSDNLTYHLKQLQKIGFIASPEKGTYRLAQQGIIYLNNNLELQHDLFPTVSCMLELHGMDESVLVMKKLKQPFLGQQHLLTFGVTSTKPLADQIQDFLERYKINANGIAFRNVHRKQVRQASGLFIFDKFFMVFTGKYTDFQREVDDRLFAAITPEELHRLPQSASANTVDFDTTSTLEFTEEIIDEST